MSWQYILISLSDAYSFVIVIYVLLSWFPMGGIIEEIRNALGKICDPFLNLFKRLIPPIVGWWTLPLLSRYLCYSSGCDL